MEKLRRDYLKTGLSIEGKRGCVSSQWWLTCPATLNERRGASKYSICMNPFEYSVPRESIQRVADLKLRNEFIIHTNIERNLNEISAITNDSGEMDNEEYEKRIKVQIWIPIYGIWVRHYLMHINTLIRNYYLYSMDYPIVLIRESIKSDFHGVPIRGTVPFAIVSNEYILVADMHNNPPPMMRYTSDEEKLLYAWALAKEYHKKPKFIIARSQTQCHELLVFEYSYEDIVSWYESKKEIMDEIKKGNVMGHPEKKLCRDCWKSHNCIEYLYLASKS